MDSKYIIEAFVINNNFEEIEEVYSMYSISSISGIQLFRIDSYKSSNKKINL